MTPDQPLTDRRRFLTAAAFAASGALAGCAGGGSDGDTDGDDEETDGSDGGETTNPDAAGEETTTESGGGQTIESMCEIQNELSGFSVVGCQSEIDGEDLIVTVTIRNDGEQEADLAAHNVEGVPYTATETDDSEMFSYSATVDYRDISIAPGETGVVVISNRFGSRVSADDIQRYVVKLSCGVGDDGLYCE